MAKTEPALIEKKRRFNWPRIFGYDFFISFKLGHPPIGTQSYASDLARRLREYDFTVFFSEEEAPPGAKLDSTLIHALQRSKILVVIANEGALVHSLWIRKEVEEFRRKHPKRPVIPINIDRAIEKYGLQVEAPQWFGHEGRIWLDETKEAVNEGITSPEILSRLQVAPRFTKANTWFRRMVASIILILIGLTSWAVYEAMDANRKFKDATAMR
ncbi:MAG TPA: toll/interleukin-1 receptor domain-containing protein, partial [Methylococcales bacterium]